MSEERCGIEERCYRRDADTVPSNGEAVDPRRLLTKVVHHLLIRHHVLVREVVQDDLEANALDINRDPLVGTGRTAQHPSVVGPVTAALPVIPHLRSLVREVFKDETGLIIKAQAAVLTGDARKCGQDNVAGARVGADDEAARAFGSLIKRDLHGLFGLADEEIG